MNITSRESQERLGMRSRQLKHSLQWRGRTPASPRAGIRFLADRSTEAEEGDEPVFLLGAGWRTGSTMVQRMLNRVPGTLLWGEPFTEAGLVPRLADSLAFLDPVNGRFTGSMLADDAPLPEVDDWSGGLTPPLEDLVAAERALIDRLYKVPAHAHGCQRWGVKEVVWDGAVVELLHLLYPRARFVLLVRHPITQWRSYRPETVRFPWFYRWPERPIRSPLAFALMWRRLVDDFLSADGRLKNAILVRYEDLGERSELDRLADFLGLPRRLVADVPEVGSSRSRDYYHLEVPAWEQALITRIVRKSARPLGYE